MTVFHACDGIADMPSGEAGWKNDICSAAYLLVPSTTSLSLGTGRFEDISIGRFLFSRLKLFALARSMTFRSSCFVIPPCWRILSSCSKGISCPSCVSPILSATSFRLLFSTKSFSITTCRGVKAICSVSFCNRGHTLSSSASPSSPLLPLSLSSSVGLSLSDLDDESSSRTILITEDSFGASATQGASGLFCLIQHKGGEVHSLCAGLNSLISGQRYYLEKATTLVSKEVCQKHWREAMGLRQRRRRPLFAGRSRNSETAACSETVQAACRF